jgi:hypothetical protein
LYDGVNAELAKPMACIWPAQGQGHVVAINSLPGSIHRFVMFVGGEDFSIPRNTVSEWKKSEKGVFVAVDWTAKTDGPTNGLSP